MNSTRLNILITAGPVWSPIDKVRVITNVFGGSLGKEIAEYALSVGHRVTLLMGPGRVNIFSRGKTIKVIRFKFYDELFSLMKKLVSTRKYSVVIHSAAVSDYQLIHINNGKIKSNQKKLVLVFKPTKKIVDYLKKFDPNIVLVKFKLEVNKTKEDLIRIAQESMVSSNADLMVANDFDTVDKNHVAYIIDGKSIKKVIKKENIARQIIKKIEKVVQEKK